MSSGAHYQINQAANTVPTGTTDIARLDIYKGQQIHLVGDSSSGQTSPAWTILAWPDGSARATPTNATTFDATYTPDVIGTYRCQLLVNDGVGANAKTFIFAVTKDSAGIIYDDSFREPAYGEQAGEDNAASNDRGYAKAFESGAKKGSFTVNTIAALRLVQASRFKRCHVLNYATAGDGGGGEFRWDAASVAADDGGTIIAPTGLATGRWKRQFTGNLNVRWFGATGDNVTDDAPAFKNARDAAIALLISVVDVPPGMYGLGSQILCHSAVMFRGTGHVCGGTSATAVGFPTVLKRFSGVSGLFKWDGSTGSLPTSGGGISQLRIVSDNASDNNPAVGGGYGVEVVASGYFQTPSWLKIEHLIIEEGAGIWTACIKFDGTLNFSGGTKIGVPDCVIQHVSTHSTANTATGFGAMNIIAAKNLRIDQVDCYQNGDIYITGDANVPSLAPILTSVNANIIHLDRATRVGIQGGDCNTVTNTTNTTGNCVAWMGPMSNPFVDSNPTDPTGLAMGWFDPNTYAVGAYGLFRFSRQIGLKVGQFLVGISNTAGNSWNLIGLKSTDVVWIDPDAKGTLFGGGITGSTMNLTGALNMSSLTASSVVATSGTKDFVSLPYTPSATAGNLAARDGSGACSFTNLNCSSLNDSGLTASQAVVTDGSKNLASLAYTSAATASTIASRDTNGDVSFNKVNMAAYPQRAYTAADTTPNVAGINYMHIANSGAITITNFTGGVTGQLLVLTFADANTTVNRANALLAGSASFVSTNGATLTLIKGAGGSWQEVHRITNNG